MHNPASSIAPIRESRDYPPSPFPKGPKISKLLIIGLAAALAACSQSQEVETANSDDLAMMPVTSEQPTGEAAGGTAFDVPSDARARYFLLDVSPGKGGNIVATTRREGPSGTTFARREIDCGGQTFRYIGEGDTLEQAKQPAPNPGEMSTLVDGSISDLTIKFACSQ